MPAQETTTSAAAAAQEAASYSFALTHSRAQVSFARMVKPALTLLQTTRQVAVVLVDRFIHVSSTTRRAEESKPSEETVEMRTQRHMGPVVAEEEEEFCFKQPQPQEAVL